MTTVLTQGIEIHKQGFMRVAMQMYTLAFFLNPLESEAEFYSAVSLHMMGEHQVTFQRLNEFIDKYPNQPWAYVIASHSCAILNNTRGLELILTKSNKNNIKLPVLDLMIGFLLESEGQTKQAIAFYEKNAQSSDNSPFSNIFNSRVERMSHE